MATPPAATPSSPSPSSAAAGPGRNGPPPIAIDAVAESWLASAQRVLSDLPGLVSDRFELLALELQSAAEALARIFALVVAVAILGVTAWLLLWAAVLVVLLKLGLPLLAALMGVLLVNLIGAAAALQLIRRQLPRIGLPATRRHLRFSPDPAAPADPPAAAAAGAAASGVPPAQTRTAAA